MIQIRTARALAVGLVLLCSGSARAHSPYLLPNLFDIGKRDHVTVLGSFTEEFFEPDVAMKSEDYHVIAPDGSKQALTPVYTRDLAIAEAETKQEGTYRISTGKRDGRIAKAAWVAGDWKFLGPREAAPAGTRTYDVKSVTRAEVYVTRGKPSNQALAPLNTGLEYHALTHPNSLFVGQPITFEVLFDGKPLVGHVVSVYASQARYSDSKAVAELTTDETGRFSFRPEKPGVYVAMSRYRPAPEADAVGSVSYTYSVVIEATE